VTAVLRSEGGVTATLGAVIARAGEGTIYAVVGQNEWVAKVFHPDLKDLVAKRVKVAAMTQSAPAGTVQSDGFVVLTWPLHLLDGDDGAVGYVMSRIDTSDAVEIHTVSNPSNRTQPLPSAPQWTPHVTWHHLLNTAANLCLAVETVHRVDAVIGDFQERNILVNNTTRVTLVDCDSMQFTDSAGHQFLCGVGRPEFTAPELARVNLSVTAREKPSDLFALAVHIHLLLMAGNHPFLRGEWTGGGDQPDAMTLAKSGFWAGGPGSPLRTHPLAPPVDFLPEPVQALFVRAFTDGARDPSRRPSASEWREALHAVQITTCPGGHQIPVEADPCPWCAIDDERTMRRGQRAMSVTAPLKQAAATAPQSASWPTAAVAYTSPAGAPSRGNRTALISALVAVAVIALVVIIGFSVTGGHDGGSSGSHGSASGSGGYSGGSASGARENQGPGGCDVVPRVSAQSAQLTTNGLSVATSLQSGCPSGDIIAGPSVLVTVSDGSRDVASGVFNLNSHPLALPESGSVSQDFVFPAGMYWRTPELIGLDSLTVNVSGVTHDDGQASNRSDPVVASQPGQLAHGDAESAAASALQELADSDYGVVKNQLADRWVPQISSKKIGLVTDGITYQNSDILRDQLTLRQRYDGVRLVYSGRWTTFSGDTWWVTVVGAPFGDSGSANGWCSAHNIDSWNCIAKMISDHMGPEGTTAIR
jgi:hypothetical protein